MAPRVTKDVTRHPWGALIWNHAPCNRTGWAGRCIHCGGQAMLRHPITNQPCHKVCDDAASAAT